MVAAGSGSSGPAIPYLTRTHALEMIEVFAYRRNSPTAAAFVERLRASGQPAREGNSQFFQREGADLSVEKVYHDGGTLVIPDFYEGRGIPCELIPGFEPERGQEIEAGPVLTDVYDVPEHSPDPGFHVEQNGAWYKLIGPDGEQVGKAQRSEAAAWEQMP